MTAPFVPSGGPALPDNSSTIDWLVAQVTYLLATVASLLLGWPFITQADWYVDPVNGNDSNSGALGSPLQTLPELARRWNGILSPSVLTANIYLAAGTYPDPLVMNYILPLQTQTLTIWGTATTVLAGTVTAFTAFNSATSTRMQFTDGAADFSTHLRRRIRMTSGAALNGLSWFGSINGNTVAQPNAFVNPVGTSPATVTPGIGDAYVVETVDTVVPYAFVEAVGAGLTIVRDMKFPAASGSRVYLNGGGSGTRMRLAGCELDGTATLSLLAGTVTVVACASTGTVGIGMTSYNGIVLQGFTALGGLVQMQQGYFLGNNVMHDGNGVFSPLLSVINGGVLEDIGTQSGHAFFGCVGGVTLVNLDDFGRWSLSSASSRFWGAAGNTSGVAIKVFNGSGFIYVTLPTATGVAPGTDVILSGAAGVAWATMPAIGAGAGNNAYVSVRQ